MTDAANLQAGPLSFSESGITRDFKGNRDEIKTVSRIACLQTSTISFASTRRLFYVWWLTLEVHFFIIGARESNYFKVSPSII